MTPEDRQRIIDEARETLARLDGLQMREQTGFDESREWQRRESPDDEEIVYSTPTQTRRTPAVVEQPPAAGVSEEYIVELVAHALAELTETYDRKIDAVRAEVKELRAEAINDLSQKLDRALGRCDTLIERLDNMREPDRAKIIDLPNPLRRVN
jgi:hypothetical protein